MELKQRELIDYYLGGFLIAVLKPIFMLAGKLMGKDHSPTPKGDIVIMKLLGGGSLILAMPALLGIRRKYPRNTFHLVTTPAIQPFARTLGLFDHIHLIDDSQGFFTVIRSSIKVLRAIFLVDTFIDLEVHSRLSTIFSGLSAARNRIGFYLRDVFWRKSIQTHLVFFNPYASVYYAYEACAKTIGSPATTPRVCRKHLQDQLPLSISQPLPAEYLVVGHACSDLSLERMLTPGQWVKALQRLIKKKVVSEETAIVFLGSSGDRDKAEKIIHEIKPVFNNSIIDFCGRCSLIESIKVISQAQYFVGIDSSLLYYARILGIPSTSYWGPTIPNSLMTPIEDYREEVFYAPIPCSPCVHITESPPCDGQAFCMENLFNESSDKKLYNLIYRH